MQHKVQLFSFACLNFELTSLKDQWSEVEAMRRKGVVFSKMFVCRSIKNELVPSSLLDTGAVRSGRKGFSRALI